MGGLIDLYYYGNDTADMDKLIIDNLDGLLSNGQ